MGEKIRTGNSIIRNPILASYIAKGLLPYRGLGSGVQRALDAWQNIDFVDDRDGCLFTATLHRRAVKTPVETPVKTPVKILDYLRKNPNDTLADVASAIGKSLSAVERASSKLVKEGKLRFVGPAKGGHWEVL